MSLEIVSKRESFIPKNEIVIIGGVEARQVMMDLKTDNELIKSQQRIYQPDLFLQLAKSKASNLQKVGQHQAVVAHTTINLDIPNVDKITNVKGALFTLLGEPLDKTCFVDTSKPVYKLFDGHMRNLGAELVRMGYSHNGLTYEPKPNFSLRFENLFQVSKTPIIFEPLQRIGINEGEAMTSFYKFFTTFMAVFYPSRVTKPFEQYHTRLKETLKKSPVFSEATDIENPRFCVVADEKIIHTFDSELAIKIEKKKKKIDNFEGELKDFFSDEAVKNALQTKNATPYFVRTVHLNSSSIEVQSRELFNEDIQKTSFIEVMNFLGYGISDSVFSQSIARILRYCFVNGAINIYHDIVRLLNEKDSKVLIENLRPLVNTKVYIEFLENDTVTANLEHAQRRIFTLDVDEDKFNAIVNKNRRKAKSIHLLRKSEMTNVFTDEFRTALASLVVLCRNSMEDVTLTSTEFGLPFNIVGLRKVFRKGHQNTGKADQRTYSQYNNPVLCFVSDTLDIYDKQVNGKSESYIPNFTESDYNLIFSSRKQAFLTALATEKVEKAENAKIENDKLIQELTELTGKVKDVKELDATNLDIHNARLEKLAKAQNNVVSIEERIEKARKAKEEIVNPSEKQTKEKGSKGNGKLTGEILQSNLLIAMNALKTRTPNSKTFNMTLQNTMSTVLSIIIDPTFDSVTAKELVSELAKSKDINIYQNKKLS